MKCDRGLDARYPPACTGSQRLPGWHGVWGVVGMSGVVVGAGVLGGVFGGGRLEVSVVGGGVIMAKATGCKATSTWSTPATCGSPELLARSYILPPRWPLPALRLIMETQPSSCDFYRSTAACCALGRHSEWLVEREVREVLISFLGHCSARLLESPPRPCRAVDLGANNGMIVAKPHMPQWMDEHMIMLRCHPLTQPAPHSLTPHVPQDG